MYEGNPTKRDDSKYSIMFLKRLAFGSKECTKELKLECVNFLGQ